MSQSTTGPGVVLLDWELARASEGISHYRVYLDDEIIGNTVEDINSYIVYNLPFYIELSFYVVALTNDYRVSKKSNTVKITLPHSTPNNLLNYKLNFNMP